MSFFALARNLREASRLEMNAMHPMANGKGRRRARVIGLTIALILLLAALLSDLGQGARDWVADLWNAFSRSAETVSAPSDSTDAADAGAGAGAPTRPLSSLPANADGALAIAAYRGQAAGAGQAKRALGPVGFVGGGPVGAATGAAPGADEQPSADGGVGPAEGQGMAGSALALADTASGGGAGGAAASGGDGFGGSGPFSTVPGGPFVNLTDGPTNALPYDGPRDDASSSVPEPGTLVLLASAVVALGARRWWRG